MNKINVNIDIELSDEEIDDILVTAFEGGINYWAYKAEPKDGDFKGASYASDALSKGATILIYDNESDDVYELTKEKFLKGLGNALVKYGHLFKMDGDKLDLGYIDAAGADIIVQTALFGEAIYG